MSIVFPLGGIRQAKNGDFRIWKFLLLLEFDLQQSKATREGLF
jgi:hypothetical protein